MAFSMIRGAITMGLLTGGVLVILAGCEVTNKTAATGPANAPSTAPALASETSKKGGAELWADTCSRCHNLRSPSSYGPAQWEVALYDMRVRANLTGEEQRKILEFLKAASQ